MNHNRGDSKSPAVLLSPHTGRYRIMKKYDHFITELILILLAATGLCACVSDQPSDNLDPDGKVEVRMQLVIADHAAASVTRAGEEYEPFKGCGPGEGMDRLRVIVIAGDGTVEHNRVSTLKSDAVIHEDEFRVRPNDIKTVLLIANDDITVIDDPDNQGSPVKASDYFSGLVAGSKVSVTDLRRITMRLDMNSPDSGRLNMALPINGIHSVEIGEEDCSARFFMTRAAVKFTYRFLNLSSREHTVDSIEIPGMSDSQFYFPSAVYGEGDPWPVLLSYTTPATATASVGFSVKPALRLPASMTEPVEISPVYFLEGLHCPEGYVTRIAVDGLSSRSFGLDWLSPEDLDGLHKPQPMTDLPRNTHVVVNVMLLDHTFVCTVDVQPYSTADLRPLFGLSRDEDGNVVDADGNIIFRVDTDDDENKPQIIFPGNQNDDEEE